jgi:glycosyltransferase involved in cell wall biosynthesis
MVKQQLLDYIFPGDPLPDFREKEKDLYLFLKQTITKEDIIHVHNPTLGKNPLFTLVLYRLAHQGYSLFYHCHDFAEDRPENYNFLKQVISGLYHKDVQSVMYPDAAHIRFGVINSSDAQRLKSFGIPSSRIIHLPNPIQVNENVREDSKEESTMKICNTFTLNPEIPVMIYPVRVIQRKNIGEYILFATLFRDKASWLVTLPPRNPVEIEHYIKWKAFCKEISSPVIFEAGDSLDFPTLMRGAYKAVTTSIREGFGMCYLEPWTFETPVTGRVIPYILSDFLQDNFQFNNLYTELPITWNNMTKDFPLFPVEIQQDIIRHMSTQKPFRDTFLSSTGIEGILFDKIPYSIIEHNKHIIEENYSLKKYGQTLAAIYRDLSREK